METTLYLIASPSSRLRAWSSVLREEGYDVIFVDSHSTGTRLHHSDKDYGIITVGLTDDLSLRHILETEDYPPNLAVHFGTQSLFPVGDLTKLDYPVSFHLADDQDDMVASLAALPASIVSLPPSSIDDNTAETPIPLTGKRIKVHQYPNTVRDRVDIWSTSLPFASQTAKYAFDQGVNEWERSAAGMSYTRIVEAIKQHLGPNYDLERLWERHTRFEFVRLIGFALQRMAS